MKIKLILLLTVLFVAAQSSAMKYRGIVYDVGLQYTPGSLSVEEFDAGLVRYDMQVIADSLHCNAVRIEGQDLDRLEAASEIAAQNGLKVFFNPWWMNADEEEVVPYMAKAAKTAERLRKKGLDITFVAGCEYSLFNRGIFKGNDVNQRIASMTEILGNSENPRQQKKDMEEFTVKLNKVLAKIVKGVRDNFKGDVTYSAGTWEPVAWTMFDVIGVDYYRDLQTDREYIDGLQKYFNQGKPVWVMEVGACTYEGAAKLGGGGFTVLQGVDKEGNGIYSGGLAPKRSEKEQADYDEQQIRLLNDSGIEGMFIFVFSFPIAPYRESGLDSDLTAYPIVKSFPKEDLRSSQMPPWQPKEAFYRIADVYGNLAD